MKNIFINNSTEKSLYQISPEQKRDIEKGRNEIEKGSFIKNESLMIGIRQYLKKAL